MIRFSELVGAYTDNDANTGAVVTGVLEADIKPHTEHNGIVDKRDRTPYPLAI